MTTMRSVRPRRAMFAPQRDIHLNSASHKHRCLRREVLVPGESDGECRQQIGGAVDVVQGDGFDGTVHVAVGNAISPVTTPARDSWMALASVPVPLPWRRSGRESRPLLAVSTSRSKSLG